MEHVVSNRNGGYGSKVTGYVSLSRGTKLSLSTKKGSTAGESCSLRLDGQHTFWATRGDRCGSAGWRKVGKMLLLGM